MKDLVTAAGFATSNLRAFNFRKAFSFALLEFFCIDGLPGPGREVGALAPARVVGRDRRR